MIEKNLSAVSEADLASLIDNAVCESRNLEFKRELPDASDQGKVKFLRSVTSLANTSGGDLIYGIQAENGAPRLLRLFY